MDHVAYVLFDFFYLESELYGHDESLSPTENHQEDSSSWYCRKKLKKHSFFPQNKK